MNETLENKSQITAAHSELGQITHYDSHYNPERLFPISRANNRLQLGINPLRLPFYGYDYWNLYELSWLNLKGKPMVAVAEIRYPCDTPYLIESKSLKLYFNSFNHSRFKDSEELKLIVEKDLAQRLEGEVQVRILSLEDKALTLIQSAPSGQCIDNLDVSCSEYEVQPNYLCVQENKTEETLYSNLLKSNCPVTNQPDWGTLVIAYQGRQIHREGLLKYLVSFRNHNDFHELCIEHIFVDIMSRCQPEKLTVYGRYTRRGGLDINPYRSTEKMVPHGLNHRLVRQ